MTEYYKQKSKLFLYPLLNLSKKLETYGSVETFLHCVDSKDDTRFIHSLIEPNLILKFTPDASNPNISAASLCIKAIRLISYTRRLVRKYIKPDSSEVYFVLSLFDKSEEYEEIITGRYSKLSLLRKHSYQKYYGVDSPEWKAISVILFPDLNKERYAEMLNIPVEVLADKVELAEPIDFEKETLRISLSEFKESLLKI